MCMELSQSLGGFVEEFSLTGQIMQVTTMYHENQNTSVGMRNQGSTILPTYTWESRDICWFAM